MAVSNSKIEWTETTWNPVVGCVRLVTEDDVTEDARAAAWLASCLMHPTPLDRFPWADVWDAMERSEFLPGGVRYDFAGQVDSPAQWSLREGVMVRLVRLDEVCDRLGAIFRPVG